MAAAEKAVSEDIMPEKLAKKFNRVVRRAKAAIFWERTWPRVVPMIGTGAVFVSASWLGLWSSLPPQGRMIGVIAFAAAFVASPLLVRSGNPFASRKEALARIDKNTDPNTLPAQTINDDLLHTAADTEKELWNLHLKETWNRWAGKFQVGKPNPNMPARDPYAVRFMPAFLLFVAAVAAGGQHVERLQQAFDWTEPPGPVAQLEVKAWVEPPENIKMAPIYITQSTPQTEEAIAQAHSETGTKDYSVHKNSVLTILVFGSESKVTVNGQEVEVSRVIETGTEPDAPKTMQYEVKLTDENTNIVISNGPKWHFAVTPDNSPTVIINNIGTSGNGNDKEPQTLEINCSATDDHGLRGGQVVIKLPGTATDPEAKPLESSKVPSIPLPLHKLCNDR